jgi:hypothetical protein
VFACCSVWNRHGRKLLSKFMTTLLVATVFNINVKSKGCVFPVHAMKAYTHTEVQCCSFLTLALERAEG